MREGRAKSGSPLRLHRKPLEMQGAGASQHRPASNCTELPRQDLNLNKESQNLNAPNAKSIPISALQQATDAGCSGERREGGITDPELARVVAAWPTLPEPIRRAMLALIRAVAP